MKKIIHKIKSIDAITLGSFFAVVALIGDHFWWARDFLLGEWSWHLAVILFCFVTALIATTYSTITYIRQKNKEKQEIEERFLQLEEEYKRLYRKVVLNEEKLKKNH